MNNMVDKLMGLADRFAILYADAREASVTDLPGSVWVDDAKRAKANLESAIGAAIRYEREACAKVCEALQVNKSPDYYPGQAFDGACRICAGEIRKRSNDVLTERP